MAELKIQIRDKVATLISQDFQLVGGNSDYKVVFDFDEAWEKHQVKTALFVFGDKTVEQVVDGNVCDGVAITNSTICLIGVYASDICTSTPAKVCDIKLSIKDFATALPQPPEKDVYDQLIELMNRYIENAQNANLPRGGLAGQVLSKKSNEDFDFEWKDVEASEEARKEIQNITSIDVIYDDVSDLPKTGVGNGTRYVALNNGRLPLIIYSYSSTKNEWEVVDECRGSTAYIVLQGEKAGMYRFTMSPPYLVSVESHTLEEAKDYTDKKIANLIPTEGLVYELNSTGEHYGCSGIGTATEKDIVIASEYNGVPVKYVAGYAFKGSGITSVTIPSGIVDIATNAFENCRSLKKVNLSEGLERIGEAAFYGCSNLTDMSLPTTLKAIYGKAFEGCIRLLQIYIPNTVTMVKYQAFRGCVSLVSAYWSEPNVTVEVGEAVFNACSSLNRIKLPKSVTSIPAGTYVGCESITSLNIPDNVTSIGTKAYQGCDALINTIIPKNVTTIGLGAFYDCDGLKTITFPDTVTQFVDAVISGEQIEEITVPFVGRTKGNTTYNKFKDIIYNGDVSTAVPSLKKVIISSKCDTMVENAFEGVSGVTICCQAESKPEGWSNNWNAGNLPVIWGYGSEAEEIAELKGSIGDISTALDELHAYAQSLIGGDSE